MADAFNESLKGCYEKRRGSMSRLRQMAWESFALPGPRDEDFRVVNLKN